MVNLFPYLDVLAVDESSMSLRFLQANLRLAGFTRVEPADGALTAAQLLSRKPYHIVFVALEMREIEGIEFLDYLRQQPKFMKTLRVAISDDGSMWRRASVVEKGADAFLVRPLSAVSIKKSIINLLYSPVARRGAIVPLAS